MAGDKKISQLVNGGNPQDTDNLVVQRGATNVRISNSKMATRVLTPVLDNILTQDATGNLKNSGKKFNNATATANDIWDAAKIDSTKADKATTITAGTGLAGGGDLSANRTLSIANTTVTAGIYGSATETVSFDVNAQGQITSATEQVIAIPATQITDFTEAAQDAVGTILTDTSTIDFTYNDSTPSVTADVKDNSITNTKLSQAAANTWKGNNTNALANVSDNNTSALTESTSSVLTITGGANATLNPVSIQVKQATTSQSGYLSSTDWNTFNSKQNTITTGTTAQYFKGDLSLGTFATDAQTAVVEDAINNGVTNKSPSENAVYDALVLKQDLIATPTNGNIVTTNGSGQTQDSGKSFSTDGTLAANSDALIATQKAVKTYVDNSIIANLKYQGTWNASTNTPTLSDGTSTVGFFYRVNVAGTQNLGSGNITFAVNDKVVYNPSGIWEKWDTDDEVLSVFGRTGAIAAQSGDYTATQITNTPAGNIAATNVQAAINELDTEKEAVANKDASNGYVGLTLFKINFKNVLNTFTSFFTNANTAARTYTFQDRDGTIADNTDLATKVNKSDFTAKGDVLVGTGSGTYQKLAVGADGTVLTADSTQATGLKYSASASVAINNKVYYVSASGNDSNVGYDINKPFLTLSAAATAAGSSGNQICVLPGTYAGNYTINNQNLTITGFNNESGGLINFTGTLTFSHTGSSIRLQSLTMANLTHSGAGGLYLENCRVNTLTTLSSAGYFQAENSDFQGSSLTGAISITGSGNKVFSGNNYIGFLTINNASAVINLSNNIISSPITLTTGTLGLNNTPVYAATNGGIAIAVAAGTFIANNANILNPNGTTGKITLASGVVYSFSDFKYDGTGINAGAINAAGTSYADKLNAVNLTASRLLVSDASKNIISSAVTATEAGYLSGVTSAIQTQLNAKEPTLTKGNLTEATSSVLTITGGSNSVIGSGTSIQVKQATTSQSGYLSSADWNTFNNKQTALGFTPENVANKETSALDTSTTKYPCNNVVKSAVDTKQDTLVSGTNIKTVNSTSLLGSGDIVISGVADGDKGDITVSSSGTVWTVDNNVITNAKAAQMAAGTVKANTTGATANASDVDIATTFKTALALTKADVGLGNVANIDTTVASNITSGTFRNLFQSFSSTTSDRTLSNDPTVSDGNFIQYCNNTVSINITLPSSPSIGKTFTIVRGNTGAVIVIGTINGGTNYTIPNRYDNITVVYNGTDWSTVDKMIVPGTNGNVLFRNNNSVNTNSNLFWDDTNNRLGIGTASPNNTLHVRDTIANPRIIIESTANNSSVEYNMIGKTSGGAATYGSMFLNSLGEINFFQGGVARILMTGDNGNGTHLAISGFNGTSGYAQVRFNRGGNNSFVGPAGATFDVYSNENIPINIGTNSAVRVTIGTGGAVRFNNYGAGTLQTDSSGNISAVSDERLKDIEGNFTRGLTDILNIQPINYKWNSVSGLEETNIYTGFSAQNVQANIPEAVGVETRADPNNEELTIDYLTLNDRPIIAALVNAVKELKSFNDALEARITALENA